MKKLYTSPVAELNALSSADVITSSGNLGLSLSDILGNFADGAVDADTLEWH